jgi:ankyrin repeat protein
MRQLIGQVRDGNVSGVRTILDRKVAIEGGQLEAAKLLASAGADFNAGRAEPPLPADIRARRADITAWLVRADVRAVNAQRESPLYAAVRAGDLNLVRALAEGGVSLNYVNANAMSSLYIAVGLRQLPIVKFLLNNGASPNDAGLPCLELAQDMRETAMANTLISAGAKAQVRKAHRSRQQMSTLARTAPAAAQTRCENGVCAVCRGRAGILRLVPCGHTVVCRKCVDILIEKMSQCPICQMKFCATAPVGK